MDSQNQFRNFLFCIAIGFIGGIGYEVFAFLRLCFGCEREKNVILGGLLDLLYFVFLAIFCVLCTFLLKFPSVRAYMWLGYGLGGIIYAKTLRRILDFCQKKCYNVLRQVISKAKIRKKLSKVGDKEYDAR